MTDKQSEVIVRNDSSDGEFDNYMYGKPVDYGANVLAGYEFLDKLSVQFNVQPGLANLQSKLNGVKQNGSLRNTGVGILLGYKF